MSSETDLLIGEPTHAKNSIPNDKELSKIDRWLNVSALIKYLPSHPCAATVYRWVHTKKIPCHKAGGLLFLKSEIDSWIKRTKRK